MAERTYSYDELFSAMCIMEEIADPVLRDAGVPWQDFRDQHGINHLRGVVIQTLAPALDNAWDRACAQRDQLEYERTIAIETNIHPIPAEPDDLGAFDYEFTPVWLRMCVDWSDIVNGPRVLGAERRAREKANA